MPSQELLRSDDLAPGEYLFSTHSGPWLLPEQYDLATERFVQGELLGFFTEPTRLSVIGVTHDIGGERTPVSMVTWQERDRMARTRKPMLCVRRSFEYLDDELSVEMPVVTLVQVHSSDQRYARVSHGVADTSVVVPRAWLDAEACPQPADSYDPQAGDVWTVEPTALAEGACLYGSPRPTPISIGLPVPVPEPMTVERTSGDWSYVRGSGHGFTMRGWIPSSRLTKTRPPAEAFGYPSRIHTKPIEISRDFDIGHREMMAPRRLLAGTQGWLREREPWWLFFETPWMDTTLRVSFIWSGRRDVVQASQHEQQLALQSDDARWRGMTAIFCSYPGHKQHQEQATLLDLTQYGTALVIQVYFGQSDTPALDQTWNQANGDLEGTLTALRALLAEHDPTVGLEYQLEESLVDDRRVLAIEALFRKAPALWRSRTVLDPDDDDSGGLFDGR